MTTRMLGTNGLKVSAVGLGCMGMSHGYGPGDEEEAVRTIERALELGVTFFDTADVYGQGANERLVGEVLKPHRGRIVLATKFGLVRGADGKLSAVNGSPDYVRSACEASLHRLGVDVIDLYYLHRVDSGTPIESTVGAMARLVEDGKVRYLGLSEAAAATIRRAHRVHPIAAVQSEYSMWWREPEASVIPVCRELGIGFVPYSPLGRGFLTGRVRDAEELSADDLRRRLPRFQGDHLQRNLELADELAQIASRRGCSAAQLALAWLLGQGQDIVPIPGTKRRQYVEENVKAADIRLRATEFAELEAVFRVRDVAGDRYPADMMRLLDRGAYA